MEFARTGAAHGVLSTLSMPIHVDGQVVGGVNLYGATPNGFAGERVASGGHPRRLGARGRSTTPTCRSPPGRRRRRAPEVLEELAVLNQATGVVVAAHAVDVEAARQIIADAAHRAGQDEVEVARALIRPFLQDHDAT